MFFTEPKFTSLTSIKQLLGVVQKFELKFRPESPVTQKSMESLGQDRLHFRRRNKFELRYDFEIQKLPYTDQDIHVAYLRYLGQLINDYQMLFEERKRIKQDLERRQRDEDELRGYKWPENQARKIVHSAEVLTLEQKMQLIEEERNKEQYINDCLAKEAIKQELERRRKDLETAQKDQNANAKRKKVFEDLKKKAIEENKKVNRILHNHRQNVSQQLEQDFRKSKSFQEKMDAREIAIQEKRFKRISEIASRNRKLEEKINQFKDDFGNRLMEELVRKQQQLELSMGKRQKTAEQLEKNRLEKQQYFEQKLNDINHKIQADREEKESQLFNRVGIKLQKSEQLIEQQEKMIQNIALQKKKELEQRFTRQSKRYREQEEKQSEKIEQWEQQLKSKFEQVQKSQKQKNEEWKSVKEQKQQNHKEHQDVIQYYQKKKEKEFAKEQDRQLRVKQKLNRLKEEQDYIKQYSTVSKQKFEQTSNSKMGELVNLKYSSSAQLLDKLKNLEDEEKFADLQLKYKSMVKIPEKKVVE